MLYLNGIQTKKLNNSEIISKVVEQVENQSFFDLVQPIFDITDFAIHSTVDTDDEIQKERQRLQLFRYEFFSVNSGSSVFKGSGMSLKKTSTTSQKKGTACKIYGCGMMGNANNPQILVPLEKIIILAH